VDFLDDGEKYVYHYVAHCLLTQLTEAQHGAVEQARMSELHTAFRWCGKAPFETSLSPISSQNFARQLCTAGPLNMLDFFLFLTPRLASLCSNVATLSLSDLDRFLARTGQYQRMRSLVKSLARVTKAPVHEIEASLYVLRHSKVQGKREKRRRCGALAPPWRF
jgi:hypothetical protein